MILPIVSGLIYSFKRRKVIEVFPSSFRELWKEWDLRLAVVLSLVLEIILILLGHRRKYKRSLFIRAVVWSFYLAADSTAIFALGILSSNLTDMHYEKHKSLDANTELAAFWAPFLLLHLGGPDTITAFSLEDNDLWTRHLIQLVIQTMVTFYVFLLAWKVSLLSILYMLMFLVGLIKYGERIYVLRSASAEKLRESLFSPQSGRRGTDLFEREKDTKTRATGVETLMVVPDNQLSVDLSVFTSDKTLSTEEKLRTVDGFQELTKHFFFDVILSARDRVRTRSVFRNMSSQDAFKIVETELGLIYDLLYTKAPLLSTPWGLALRGITFFVTCSVLVGFTFLDHKKNSYSKIDLIITFLLLIVAVILEVYSAFLLLLSDQFLIWLTRHKRIGYILKALIPREPKKRWSHQISQWSLLRSFEKPLPCLTILKHQKLDKLLEKRRHVVHKDPEGIKILVLPFLKFLMRSEIAHKAKDEVFSFVVIPTAQGEIRSKEWPGIANVNEELGTSIIFWHIVTEVCYNLDKEKKEFEDMVGHCKLIKYISRYMAYLLLKYPSLLSVGADMISLHKTIDQAIDELRRVADGIRKNDKTQKELDRLRNRTQAYKELVKCKEPDGETSGRWNQPLYDALKFAGSISSEKDLKEKWNQIGVTWLFILHVAADRSKGKDHAQQLRRGGELFTHVWLLMAHLGLTGRFDLEGRNIVWVTTEKNKKGRGEMIP